MAQPNNLTELASVRLVGGYIKGDFIVKGGILLLIAGLFTMEFFHILSNIGIIVLTLYSIWYLVTSKGSVQKIFRSPFFTPFILIFFLYLANIILTDKGNFNLLFHQLEKKIIFLVLPFCFIILPPFKKKLYEDAYFLFFLLVLFTAIPCTVAYSLHKEEILTSYTRSGVLPTPINHIRYSLMVCYAIYLGVYLIFKDYYKEKGWIRSLIIIGLMFLIFFLHLLAVRSGLICFYTILFIILIHFLIKKNYTALLTLLTSSVILIIISFQNIETLQAKWGYTLYDLEQSSSEKIPNGYSISGRLLSNKITYSIFKEHILLGVGEANLKSEMKKEYKEHYSHILESNYIMPHNEYLRALAASGIVGFLVFFTCFCFPLFHNKNFNFFPLLTIYVILGLSFIVEDTLHTQLGATFGLFFIMINLHFLKGSHT